MKIILDNNPKCKSISVGEYLVHYIGNYKCVSSTIESIATLGEWPKLEYIDLYLNKLTTPIAVIMESTHTIVAFTDQFRCYPLFYTEFKGGAISNNARKLNIFMGKGDWNNLSVEEFFMTGYVSGSDTLKQNLKQLQSGERIVITCGNNHVNIKRYYRYNPVQEEGRTDKDWIDELDNVMNNVTQKMIACVDGRPIRSSLSAGLDSRVIVSKLHEAKYDNLKTFSYGPPGNWEARGARTVSKRLGVPWELITTNRKEAHKMFWGAERKAYWDFSDGFSALPNFQEYYTMSKLHGRGGMPKDAILINGQSGDFITGGHIPEVLLRPDANVRTLLDSIISKHYSMWKNLITPERLEYIEIKILELLGVSIDSKLDIEELVSIYERWECEERQSKWVIHGQRAYDFFGYDWQLPLWDIELVNFYKKDPIPLKLDQRLYRLWLDRWNYKGLFHDFNPTVWRLPGSTLAVVPLAKIIGGVLGSDAKQSWYELFFYWGHDADHYAPYSYKEYYKDRGNIRNSISLNIRTWSQENSLPKEIGNI